MKKIIFPVFMLITANVFSQKKSVSSTYDSSLAKTLGADEYGMKHYVMAFLKKGQVKLTDSTQRANLMAGHLNNISRLAQEGKLVVAGPFLDDQNIRGIYILNVTSIEEAKKLTETDPAIKAGILEMELHPWYGSAALMMVTRIHRTLEKKSITK